MIRGNKGLTVAEVLVATAFNAITAGAIGVGFMQGTGSVETGRQQTTAVYLAEQRLEQLKAWSLNSTGGQGWASLATSAAGCTNHAYNAIADYGKHRRTVAVTAKRPNNKVIPGSGFHRPGQPVRGDARNRKS